MQQRGRTAMILTEDAKTEEYTAGCPCGAYIETPCKFEACRAWHGLHDGQHSAPHSRLIIGLIQSVSTPD